MAEGERKYTTATVIAVGLAAAAIAGLIGQHMAYFGLATHMRVITETKDIIFDPSSYSPDEMRQLPPPPPVPDDEILPAQ